MTQPSVGFTMGHKNKKVQSAITSPGEILQETTLSLEQEDHGYRVRSNVQARRKVPLTPSRTNQYL